jgi:hypothetical protein
MPRLEKRQHETDEQKDAPVREEYLRLANLEKPRKKPSD